MPDRTSILKAAQREPTRHFWDTFVDQAPSIAKGGTGVVVPSCPVCNKRLYTASQFVEHLANDVLPGIIDDVLASK